MAEPSCWYCEDIEDPAEVVQFFPCSIARGHTYMAKEEAQAAARSIGAGTSAYKCRWMLRCENSSMHDGCGREFPGTEHWHVD